MSRDALWAVDDAAEPTVTHVRPERPPRAAQPEWKLIEMPAQADACRMRGMAPAGDIRRKTQGVQACSGEQQGQAANSVAAA